MTGLHALRGHWPEYHMEAWGLVSSCSRKDSWSETPTATHCRSRIVEAIGGKSLMENGRQHD